MEERVLVRTRVKIIGTKLKIEKFQNKTVHDHNSDSIVTKPGLGSKQLMFQDLETRKQYTHEKGRYPSI